MCECNYWYVIGQFILLSIYSLILINYVIHVPNVTLALSYCSQKTLILLLKENSLTSQVFRLMLLYM